MAKWFSFNQQTQRVEEVEPSEELFNSSPLLFWSRGMNEWERGPKALEHFLRPPEPVVDPSPVIPVVEEKKQKIGPFYKKEIVQPSVTVETPVPVFVPDKVAQKEPPVKDVRVAKKKRKNKQRKKQGLRKPIAKKEIRKKLAPKKKQRKKRRR